MLSRTTNIWSRFTFFLASALGAAARASMAPCGTLRNRYINRRINTRMRWATLCASAALLAHRAAAQFASTESTQAADFSSRCAEPAASLQANATHALVTLTYQSERAEDGPPLNRTVFTYATWNDQLGAQPCMWDPSQPRLNPPTASAFNPAWVAPGAERLTEDAYMYPGGCSLAIAAAFAPRVDSLTIARSVPLPPGVSTPLLSSRTVQAAGCACATALKLPGGQVALAAQGQCLDPSRPSSMLFSAAPFSGLPGEQRGMGGGGGRVRASATLSFPRRGCACPPSLPPPPPLPPA